MRTIRWTPVVIEEALAAHRTVRYEAESRIEEITQQMRALDDEAERLEALAHRHKKAQSRLVDVARGLRRSVA